MFDLTTYFIGEKQYDTNGYIVLVSEMSEVDKVRLEKIEPLVNSVLEAHRGKPATVTLSVSQLKEAFAHMRDEKVSFFVESPDKPILIVSSKDEFVVLNPVFSTSMKYPCIKQSAQHGHAPDALRDPGAVANSDSSPLPSIPDAQPRTGDA